jgi:glutamate dehydrogenase
MNVHDFPLDTDDSAGQALIGAASAALAKRRSDIPGGFLAELLGSAVPDDLRRYGPDELAAIAERSWSLLAVRKAGAPKISFEPAPALAPVTRTVAVLDIINDDMPFLLDSVVGELNQRGLDIRLLVHPVFAVERDSAGALTAFKGVAKDGGRHESFIHIHIEGVAEAARRAEIVAALEDILAQVRVTVQDWRPMLEGLRAIIAELRADPPPLDAGEVAEGVQFLEWLAADNFTLLGTRDYVFTGDAEVLEPLFETGLGLLRSRDVRPLQRWNQPLVITPDIRAFLEQPRLLVITKSTLRSPVHRRVDMDYIGVKRFDRDGKLAGEYRICGLFTSTAYTRSVRAIPYLRRKADDVIRRAGFDHASHSGKALVNVLETYPRDELFQIDEDLLYDFALAILQLGERPRVRVLPRRDRFDRFVSVLVYVPRERYDGRIRALIGDYLSTAFNGEVRAFYPFFTEGPLVRVHFIIGRAEGEAPDPDRATLDRAVESIVRSWIDGLNEALAAAYDPGKAHTLAARYRGAFPIDYREVYTPAIALGDIRVVELLTAERPLGVDFYRPGGVGLSRAGLKVFSRNRPISLSERVPVLEDMGFRVVDERTYHIKPEDAAEVWFHDMEIESASGEPIDLAALEQRLEACFLVVMGKRAESDGYNALVLGAGLGWRDVALIRTISRFLRQIRVPYSQGYMWATLRKHSAIAAQIVTLFHIRFDPHLQASNEERTAREAEIAAVIAAALQAVESLDEDRILRHFVDAVQAAIRTNFY